jgi:hypothetical protein
MDARKNEITMSEENQKIKELGAWEQVQAVFNWLKAAFWPRIDAIDVDSQHIGFVRGLTFSIGVSFLLSFINSGAWVAILGLVCVQFALRVVKS